MSDQISTAVDDFFAKEADADGNISDEAMSAFLSGNYAPSPDTTAAASGPAANVNPPAAAMTPEQILNQDPVVLAKDGIHTMPFSVVAGLRDENATLKAELARLSAVQPELEDKIQEAQETDAMTGNDDAMTELRADVDADYPGMGSIFDKIAALEKALAQQQPAAQPAADTPSMASLLAPVHADYDQVTAPNNTQFWDWFHALPNAEAIRNSGDARMVSESITQFKAHLAAGGDTARNSGQTMKTPEEVARIIADADKRTAITSLSDIPGGEHPAASEEAAIDNMNSIDMLTLFENKSPAWIESYLSRTT